MLWFELYSLVKGYWAPWVHTQWDEEPDTIAVHVSGSTTANKLRFDQGPRRNTP